MITIAVVERLSEEEAALFAIMTDPSGIDQAEFLWHAPEQPENYERFRAWPFQYPWWRCEDTLQIDCAGRSVGKSTSIILRACALPFVYPGEEMLITAPFENHLDAIIDKIEDRVLRTFLYREMLRKTQSSNGIKHRPFQMNFSNGSRILGRIPGPKGAGVKGCVDSTALVLTDRGLVEARLVTEQDRVWTHSKEWEAVSAVQTFEVDESYTIGGRGIASTGLLVSDVHRVYGRENLGSPKVKRQLADYNWFGVEELDKIYWASPSEFKPLPVPEMTYRNGNSKFVDMECYEFWWLVGLYLADGYLTISDGKRGRVNIVAHPKMQKQVLDSIEKLGFRPTVKKRDHSSADIIEFSSTPFALWLEENCGRSSNSKRLPVCCLGLDESFRDAVVSGYWYGDGAKDNRNNFISFSSASKALILGMSLLVQTLGFSTSISVIQPKVTEIMGVKLKKKPQLSWRLKVGPNGKAIGEDGFYAYKIQSVVESGPATVTNIVTKSHSYIADNIVNHNTHPLMLEQDEAQNYINAGFIELNETLKTNTKNDKSKATWRCHGVTTGERNKFYENSQPGSGWTVHRIKSFFRPTWTFKEKAMAIQKYGGSENDPDYRRNIHGDHGAEASFIFVLYRLMQCVDTNRESDYNENEFTRIDIKGQRVDEKGSVYPFLDLPMTHKKYKNCWAGMDIGLSDNPSEILVFGEETMKGHKDPVLKLLARIHLEQVKSPDQARVILWLTEFYNLRAISLDRTGMGQPILDFLQEMAEDEPNIKNVLRTIKGYNFSEKILVGFDETVEVTEGMDLLKEAGIYRRVLEASTDKLRELVDAKRILLPENDTDEDHILNQFKGQTYTFDSRSTDAYGRRIFSRGEFHALDAARMAVLGYAQDQLETFVKDYTKKPPDEDVIDFFF